MEKNFIKTLLTASLLAITALGCVHAQYAPADAKVSFSKRTNSDGIKIYRSQLPEKKFTEIGSIHASGPADKCIDALRENASEAGGDALIHFEPYPGGASATVVRFQE